MNESPFGPHGSPVGDPGFTISIEIDTMLEDLTEAGVAKLLASVGVPHADLDESALCNARIVFRLPHCGWLESGRAALDAAAKVGRQFTVVGAETCRSDLFARETWFSTLPTTSDTVDDRTESNRYTVTVDVDTSEPGSERALSEHVRHNVHFYGPVGFTPSPPGRQHLVVEHSSHDVLHAAYLSLKSLWTLSSGWQINRIRVVASDVYRLELSDRRSAIAPPLPEWQYAVNEESSRLVVVPDVNADLAGWSIEATTQDDESESARFYLDRVWRDDNGIVNLRGVGRRVGAWTAEITGGANLDRFVTPGGAALPIDRWDACANWLVESLIGNPAGLIIDLGPSDYDPEQDDDVVNAQLHKLDDDVVMVRRSRLVLEQLRFTDQSVDGLELDLWHHDGHFDDCTDGYLFTRDLRLAASACTAWFRDHGKVDALNTLGCSYSLPDHLPRNT